MKTANHLQLADYLLRLPDGAEFSPAGRFCFRLGCVLPDYLFFTYLHGICKSRRMIGHHYPYSRRRMKQLIKRIPNGQLFNPLDCFRFGLLFHYLADSFTYPHTPPFSGNTVDHNAYELEISFVFSDRIARTEEKGLREPMPQSLLKYLQTERALCRAQAQTPTRDADRILRVCAVVFLYFTRSSAKKSKIK